MGVDNLLNFVKNATTPTHVTEINIKNSSVAVDISHWIYRASYGCCETLYHRDRVHDAYKVIINYIDSYVKMLKHHEVKITFVFDGMKIPAKQVTHAERAAKKAEARRLVEKFLSQKNLTEARKHMYRCMDIKFDVVQQVIGYCKREGIDFIVAPYEADAQLAHLEMNGICEFIITEDTDLILYGCKKIIYKLDTFGQCLLYELEKLDKCFSPSQIDFEKFRRICIMSGCDYLKNIPSVGLQSAKKFFTMTKQDNMRLCLPKLSSYLKAPRLAGKVTPEYINGFIDAESTFKHHIVYDPINETLRPLEPYPKGRSSSDYPRAGKRFHNVMARDLAKGLINLDTLNPDRDLDSASDDSESDESPSDETDLVERSSGILKEHEVPRKLRVPV